MKEETTVKTFRWGEGKPRNNLIYTTESRNAK